jgi:putative DNA primase/helicase
VSQGRGKGRGSIQGLARQLTSQTVLISSGEQPITSFTQDGGTRARVVELWGAPFGERNKVNGRTVRNLNRKIKRHYGHAGAAFVLGLLRQREKWPGWIGDYRKRVAHYVRLSGNDPLGGRRAEHLALIWLAAKLAHEVLDLPWDFADPVKELWSTLMANAGEADRAVAALKYVYDWATAHRGRFHERSVYGHEPHDGWAGSWKGDSGVKPWKYIGFIPAILNRILADGKFDVDAIIRTWADRAWLLTTSEAGAVRRQKKVRLGNDSTWVFAIRRSALREQLKLDL